MDGSPKVGVSRTQRVADATPRRSAGPRRPSAIFGSAASTALRDGHVLAQAPLLALRPAAASTCSWKNVSTACDSAAACLAFSPPRPSRGSGLRPRPVSARSRSDRDAGASP